MGETIPQYPSGDEVLRGDRVRMSGSTTLDTVGSVVAVIETGRFSGEFPEEESSYLKTGFIVLFDEGTVVHYLSDADELLLIARC